MFNNKSVRAAVLATAVFFGLLPTVFAQSMLTLGAGKENPPFTGQIGTVEATGTGNLTQITGTWNTSTFVISSISITGLAVGQYINSDASTSGFLPTIENTISALGIFTFGPTLATAPQTAGRLNISDIKGTLSNGSPIISGLTIRQGAGRYILAPGMGVYGNGIPGGSTITSVNSGVLGQSVPIGTLGPTQASSGPFNNGLTGNWTTLSLTINTVTPSTAGFLSTMWVMGCTTNNTTTANTSCGLFPTADSINTIPTASTFTLLSATKPSTAETQKNLYISSVKAAGLSGNSSLTSVTFAAGASIKNCAGATPTIADIVPGMWISGPGIVPGTYVTAASGTTITLSQNATTGATTGPYMLTNKGANTTNGSNVLTCVSLASVPTIGTPIAGIGIPDGSTITGVTGDTAAFAVGSGALTISNNATATGNIMLDGNNTITISNNATRTGQAALLLETGFGVVTAGSTTVSGVSFPVVPTVGGLISIPGTGLPGGTTIATAPSSLAAYQAGTGTITLSAAPPNGAGPTTRFLLTR